MDISRIIEDTAETLVSLPELAGVDVLEEDKGDVSSKLDLAMAKTKPLAAVVGWNGFAPQIVGETAPGSSVFGSVTIVVQVFEKPVVNRRTAGSPRLLAIAQSVAKAIDGAASEGMDDTLHLRRISPISELDRGVITCDVEFVTKATL